MVKGTANQEVRTAFANIFDEIQTRIKDMNEDPEWRDKMIDYETRMLEKEQEAEEKGMQKGIASATVSGIKIDRCFKRLRRQ